MGVNSKKLLARGGALLLALAINGNLAEPAAAATEAEKLEEVREMFSSKFQEEDYYRTDRLLLTATGNLQSLHRAPAVASVITAEEIEQMGATSLDEVLESVPGLHVGISTKNRMAPLYSIRGIHTSINPQVLLMVNGLPVTYTYTGGRPETFKMPMTAVSRVEVIRGPGSAVYGADAFAGVINVITKKSYEMDGTAMGIRGGSFDSRGAWLQHGGKLGSWDVAMTLEHTASSGDPDRIVDSDLQTLLGPAASLAPGEVDSNYKIWDGSLELSRGNWTMRFWNWLQDEGGLGLGVAQALAPLNNEKFERFQADVTYRAEDILPEWDMSARLSYVYMYDDAFLHLLPPGAAVPVGADGNIDFVNPVGAVSFPDGIIGNPSIVEHQSGLDLTAFYSGLNKHLWRFGTGFKYMVDITEESKNFGPGTALDGGAPPPVQDGTMTDISQADIFMQNQRRQIAYCSIQDEWSFAKKWQLTGGVRFDHYSDFGNTVNPRAALVWETTPTFTSKLLYGKAFRPPSLVEQFATNNPSAQGNPDLEPETIETYELAFDYQATPSLRLMLNLFAYEVEDLIEMVPDPAPSATSTSQNNKNQKGHGYELEADWAATDTLRLRGNFSYQRSRDKDTKALVAEAPGWQLFLDGYWEFLPKWGLDTQVIWVGDRRRNMADEQAVTNPYPVRAEIDDYLLTHLSLHRKKIAGHWDASLTVRNLFDVDAREPGPTTTQGDFPLPGRSILGQLRYAF